MKYFQCPNNYSADPSAKLKRRQDKETQENERGGHEGVRKMSVSQASALLHLPMDFKKEFNETIGYS